MITWRTRMTSRARALLRWAHWPIWLLFPTSLSRLLVLQATINLAWAGSSSHLEHSQRHMQSEWGLPPSAGHVPGMTRVGFVRAARGPPTIITQARGCTCNPSGPWGSVSGCGVVHVRFGRQRSESDFVWIGRPNCSCKRTFREARSVEPAEASNRYRSERPAYKTPRRAPFPRPGPAADGHAAPRYKNLAQVMGECGIDWLLPVRSHQKQPTEGAAPHACVRARKAERIDQAVANGPS